MCPPIPGWDIYWIKLKQAGGCDESKIYVTEGKASPG